MAVKAAADMKPNLFNIRAYILQSSLALPEKAEFSDVLSRAKDGELEPLVKLFAEDPSWVAKLYHNYKDKEKALAKRDPELWGKILNDEEAELRALEK